MWLILVLKLMNVYKLGVINFIYKKALLKQGQFIAVASVREGARTYSHLP